MNNDYVWMQLHHQRENELRTAALRRGGDTAPMEGLRHRAARWLRVRRTAVPTMTTPAVTVRAGRRRTASHAPTAAALAWRRLASGHGTLEPATPSSGELERDAA